MPEESYKIGEVVESSSNAFIAQCELHRPPIFGSFVFAGDTASGIIGVVHYVETKSVDPGRRVTALGGETASIEDIYNQNPQLSQLLRTDFRALIVGYKLGGNYYQNLPSMPAQLHSYVYPCSKLEVREFTQQTEFLKLALSIETSSGDEVIRAMLRQASACQDNPDDFLLSAGKTLAMLLPQDLPRLSTLLARLRPQIH